jgi:hypothetical protein
MPVSIRHRGRTARRGATISTDIDAAAAEPGAGRRDALAGRAGIDTRYAREWLEQQAVAGFQDVEPAGDYELRG